MTMIQLAMINIHHRLTALSTASLAPGGGEVVLFRSQRRLPGGGLYRPLDDVRPVLQVHDELLFEVRPADLHRVSCCLTVTQSLALQYLSIFYLK